MCNGYARQPLVLYLFENVLSAFAKFLGGRAAEGIMPLIKRGQQANVFIRIDTLKAMIGALLPFNVAGVTVLLNQSCDLLS